MYPGIKHLHVLCAVLSGSGFLLQGIWMLKRSPLLNHRLTRVVPHVIDTVFLGSAIALVVLGGWYPSVAPWVAAKIVGLVVYILFGAVALRLGPTMATRKAAFVAAVATFAWIVSVALTKNPTGFFAFAGDYF